MEENAQSKRRKKENKKEIRKQAKSRLMNRRTEIKNNLLGADTAKNISSYIEYNLKPKFHFKTLTFLRDKGFFCGEALGHVNCTFHRLKATTET